MNRGGNVHRTDRITNHLNHHKVPKTSLGRTSTILLRNQRRGQAAGRQHQLRKRGGKGLEGRKYVLAVWSTTTKEVFKMQEGRGASQKRWTNALDPRELRSLDRASIPEPLLLIQIRSFNRYNVYLWMKTRSTGRHPHETSREREGDATKNPSALHENTVLNSSRVRKKKTKVHPVLR